MFTLYVISKTFGRIRLCVATSVEDCKNHLALNNFDGYYSGLKYEIEKESEIIEIGEVA